MEFRADTARPVDIEKGADQTIRFPLFGEDGAEVAVGGSVEVFRTDGTSALASAPVTLDGLTATLVLDGTEFASDTLGAGWQVLWSLTPTGGVARRYKQRALLVRQRLYPVVNNDRLLERHPELSALYPDGSTSWDTSIGSAWDTLNTRLLQTGKRPDLILSPDSLFEAHIALSLSRVFRTCSTYTAAGSRYVELADLYFEEWGSEWNRIQLYIDRGDGQAAEAPVAAQPVTFLGGTGVGGFWSHRRPK